MALGAATLATALFAVVHTYLPCPFWDQWDFIDELARGEARRPLAWLWSQHNEHRLVLPRVLTALDLAVFGGRNLSLLAEIFLVQAAHAALFGYLILREAALPRGVRLSLGGVFCFSLFHLNQLENFTWGFQTGFVLPFLIAAVAFALLSHYPVLSGRPWALAFVACAPLLAGMNVSGALLIAPVALALALARRLSRRVVVLLASIHLLTAIAYFSGYRFAAGEHPLRNALNQPEAVYRYVLIYFGASWWDVLGRRGRLLALLAIASLVVPILCAWKRPVLLRPLEWVCLADCVFLVGLALVTALGRLPNGIDQASAGRYQTPAMIFWAAWLSLVVLALGRYATGWPVVFAQTALVLLFCASARSFPSRLYTAEHRAALLNRACRAVLSGQYDSPLALHLCPDPAKLARGGRYLTTQTRFAKPPAP